MAVRSRLSLSAIAWLLVFNCATIVADEKPTPIATAVAAVEANMKTSEGKAYDAQVGKELVKKYPPVMKACKEKANGEARSFDMLVRVEKDGAVGEVLLYPSTKVGQCLRETMLKDAFSPPPTPAHWVDIRLDAKK